MAFCKNCGQQLDEGAAFCAKCGTPAEQQAQQQPAYNPQQPQQAYGQPQQQPYGQPMGNVDPDVQQNRGIAWLSYVGLLFLIPLFARKKSPYCQFHVKQGATLFALELAYGIAKAIIMAILGLIFSERYYGIRIYNNGYYVFDTIFNLAYIFFTVVAIIGIVFAAKGQKKELPVVSQIPWISTLMDKIYASLNK